MIKDQEVDELVQEPRIELSEVGAYNSEAVVTLDGVEYSVHKRLADDGFVWWALVVG
ncbi:hypothetical protein [Microbulbifer sp. ZKSA002]|uniref:hypothetical protein n=1 Tax=Microbulbifer sp. ZKSA002 TaxID=3243388 RepID=UPI00403A1658